MPDSSRHGRVPANLFTVTWRTRETTHAHNPPDSLANALGSSKQTQQHWQVTNKAFCDGSFVEKLQSQVLNLGWPQVGRPSVARFYFLRHAQYTVEIHEIRTWWTLCFAYVMRRLVMVFMSSLYVIEASGSLSMLLVVGLLISSCSASSRFFLIRHSAQARM